MAYNTLAPFYAVPVAAGTVNIPAFDGPLQTAILNPAGTLATLSVVLPAAADGQTVKSPQHAHVALLGRLPVAEPHFPGSDAARVSQLEVLRQVVRIVDSLDKALSEQPVIGVVQTHFGHGVQGGQVADD
jgi:hypothetical protein